MPHGRLSCKGEKGDARRKTRQEAFVAAVRAAGCECALHGVEPHAGAEPDWNLDIAKPAPWLRGLPKPVGILTWNADSGRQLIYACMHAGLHVPEEVSLLSGSDDDLLCEVSFIPMSAVPVAAEQIGFHAAELLDRRMRGRKAPARPTLIPPLGIVTRQSTDTPAIADRALLSAIRSIRDSASLNIQVSGAVRHAGLSRRGLERRFTHVLGRSPAEEISRVHFERARSLLVGTEMSIPEVAAASGFGSPGYPAHVFKADTGLTPLNYRRQIRGR